MKTVIGLAMALVANIAFGQTILPPKVEPFKFSDFSQFEDTSLKYYFWTNFTDWSYTNNGAPPTGPYEYSYHAYWTNSIWDSGQITLDTLDRRTCFICQRP